MILIYATKRIRVMTRLNSLFVIIVLLNKARTNKWNTYCNMH
mgnify:CR=1 FL=1